VPILLVARATGCLPFEERARDAVQDEQPSRGFRVTARSPKFPANREARREKPK
jgi:hypothetical protein